MYYYHIQVGPIKVIFTTPYRCVQHVYEVLSGKAAEILLHQLKVMPDLLLMLRQFRDDDVACTVCMNAMWSLCATGTTTI